MTSDPSTAVRAPGTCDTRDFDYGVGDELRAARREACAEIAGRIRRAAGLDLTGTPREKQIYELAAQIAERLG